MSDATDMLENRLRDKQQAYAALSREMTEDALRLLAEQVREAFGDADRFATADHSEGFQSLSMVFYPGEEPGDDDPSFREIGNTDKAGAACWLEDDGPWLAVSDEPEDLEWGLHLFSIEKILSPDFAL